MKNEPERRANRIVELLAESLKRQDQMVEEMKGMRQDIGGLNERMDKSEKQQKEYNERVVASVNALADIVQKWMVETKKIESFEDRIRRLEKHTGLE